MNTTQTGFKFSESLKPCQGCGSLIKVGIIACSACQKEWQIAFQKSHPWLKSVR